MLSSSVAALAGLLLPLLFEGKDTMSRCDHFNEVQRTKISFQ
jgi:hypothetical protein